MKTKIILSLMVMLSIMAISATNPTEPAKETAPAEAKLQCGVTASQIINYLKNCSHHHTFACCVVDIPGTCNSTATIENCGTATVFVQDGIIVGHQDMNGYCGN